MGVSVWAVVDESTPPPHRLFCRKWSSQ